MGTDVDNARANAEKRKLFVRRFHQPDFGDMLARLIDKTERKIASLKWMQVASGPTPAGKEAADIVYEVVTKALRDDKETGPPETAFLEEWIWDKVRSAVSNFVRSYENRMRSRNYEAGQHPVYDDGDGALQNEYTAARAAIDSEIETMAKEVITRFGKFVSDDPQLTGLLECLRANITKREEIAQYLEVTPAEVTNIGKRLKRREQEFAAKNQDLNPFKD